MSASQPWAPPRSAMSVNFPALLNRLVAQHGLADLGPESFDAFAQAPGEAVVLLVEDPERGGENWDLAVIFCDLLAASGSGQRTGLLRPPAAAALQPQFGIQRLPALLFLRDGDYVGALEGLRDWSEFVAACREMRQRPISRAPGRVIAVASSPSCH